MGLGSKLKSHYSGREKMFREPHKTQCHTIRNSSPFMKMPSLKCLGNLIIPILHGHYTAPTTLNPKPLNPKTLNPKPLNPKAL